MPFLKESDTSYRISPFFHSLSTFASIISRFLSSNWLILSAMWSALFLILSNALFFLFIESFSGRISIWLFFSVSVSLAKYSFCSFILFPSSLNCLSEFLEHCHFLCVIQYYCSSCSEESLVLCWCIWSGEHLSSLRKARVCVSGSTFFFFLKKTIYFHRYSCFFRFFSHVSYYRILSRIPCAIYPCWLSIVYMVGCIC